MIKPLPKQCLASLLACVLLANTTVSCAVLDHLSSPPRTTRINAVLPTARLSDPRTTQYVEQLAQRLIAQVARDATAHPLRVRVDVLNTSRIQAWSSARIAITRGMLNVLMNEAELACLLSHEIGHKVLHGRGSASGRRKPGNRSEIAQARYSRQREQEADVFGIHLCQRAGYDPYALVHLFDRLAHYQKKDLFHFLASFTASHQDFDQRAAHIRKHLQRQGTISSEGSRPQLPYRAALAALRAIRTGDATTELLPGGTAAALRSVRAMQQEIAHYRANAQPIPVERFLIIMDELSRYTTHYGLSDTTSTAYHGRFMKEVLSQDAPLWDHDELRRAITAALADMARLGIGFIPIIGDAVDVYELLAGKEFGTGRLLTSGERLFTAMGILAGSGKLWRDAAHGIDLTLHNAKLSNRLSHRMIAGADQAIARAGELLSGVEHNTERLTVIGRRWDTAVARDWPGHEILDLPDGAWRIETNEAWVHAAIQRKAKVYVASPQIKDNLVHLRTGELTIFARELEWFKQAGYRQVGDYLLSPY